MIARLKKWWLAARIALSQYFFGCGYAVYYPDSQRVIWTPQLARILGVNCERKILVTEWRDFAGYLFDKLCRQSLAEYIGNGKPFRTDCIAVHAQTGGQIFLRINGRWIRENGVPVCLEMFVREYKAREHSSTFQRIRLKRIIESYAREGTIPAEIMDYLPSHDRP